MGRQQSRDSQVDPEMLKRVLSQSSNAPDICKRGDKLQTDNSKQPVSQVAQKAAAAEGAAQDAGNSSVVQWKQPEAQAAFATDLPQVHRMLLVVCCLLLLLRCLELACMHILLPLYDGALDGVEQAVEQVF